MSEESCLNSISDTVFSAGLFFNCLAIIEFVILFFSFLTSININSFSNHLISPLLYAHYMKWGDSLGLRHVCRLKWLVFARMCVLMQY